MKVGLFDLEANGFLQQATRVHCGVIKVKGGESRAFRPHQMKEMLEYMDSFDVLIAHNGIGYDFPLLEKLHGWKFKGKKVDTLVMSRLLNPKRLLPYHCPNKKCGPHSIEAWGWRVGRGKPEHNDWENFSEDMLHRCSEDTEILELVYDALITEAKGGTWRSAFLLSFELFENLQKQEEYGWLVDKVHMHKCIRQLTRWIDMIDNVLTARLPTVLEIDETKQNGEFRFVSKPFLKSGKLSETARVWTVAAGFDSDKSPIAGPFSRISFRKTNLNSGQETKDFLLSLGWEPLEWNTDDEGKRTSPKLSKEDPFEGITDKVGNLVAKRVQCRQRRGIIEGLLGIVRPDCRVSSIVNTLAVTGRATHRGIVNIPAAGKSFYGKSMRRIFTSGGLQVSKRKVLVGTDSDACQIRMLCGRMDDDEYTDNVLNGKKEDGTDIHSVNMRAAGLPSRDAAKTFFYGFLFGAGDGKVGKIVKGTPADGKRLKAQFLEGLPALAALLQRLSNEWKTTAKRKMNVKFNRMEYYDGKITGLDGRPIVVPSEHQLLVYLLQSDEAIMMAKAYNLTCAKLREKYVYGEQYGVVAWYHDEYTIECDEDIAEDVKKISEDSIREAGEFFNIKCPHIGQGKIGVNWYDIH